MRGSDGTFRRSILMQVNLLKVVDFRVFWSTELYQEPCFCLETNMHLNLADLKFHLELVVITKP